MSVVSTSRNTSYIHINVSKACEKINAGIWRAFERRDFSHSAKYFKAGIKENRIEHPSVVQTDRIIIIIILSHSRIIVVIIAIYMTIFFRRGERTGRHGGRDAGNVQRYSIIRESNARVPRA